MILRETLWHRFLHRPHRLVVQSNGTGQPLVLLHGIGASGQMWQPLLAQFDLQKWQVIMPDLLGFGESPRPEWGSYTVVDHARAVVAMLKKLKIRRPVVIIAHSMGCLVAAHIARAYPRKIARLVLYAPPLFTAQPEFPRHARKRQRYFAFYEYIATHPNLVFLPQRRLGRLAKRLTGLDLEPQKWLPFERSLRNTIMQQQAYQDFLQLQTPTDIVYGRLDFVVVKTEVGAMLKANKNITLHTVTGGHGVSGRTARFLYSLLRPPADK